MDKSQARGIALLIWLVLGLAVLAWDISRSRTTWMTLTRSEKIGRVLSILAVGPVISAMGLIWHSVWMIRSSKLNTFVGS